MQSDECERSGSSWKQVQGIENHLERSRLSFHIMQISDYLYDDPSKEILSSVLCT